MWTEHAHFSSSHIGTFPSVHCSIMSPCNLSSLWCYVIFDLNWLRFSFLVVVASVPVCGVVFHPTILMFVVRWIIDMELLCVIEKCSFQLNSIGPVDLLAFPKDLNPPHRLYSHWTLFVWDFFIHSRVENYTTFNHFCVLFGILCVQSIVILQLRLPPWNFSKKISINSTQLFSVWLMLKNPHSLLISRNLDGRNWWKILLFLCSRLWRFNAWIMRQKFNECD